MANFSALSWLMATLEDGLLPSTSGSLGWAAAGGEYQQAAAASNIAAGRGGYMYRHLPVTRWIKRRFLTFTE
jgi:hypothetical protein